MRRYILLIVLVVFSCVLNAQERYKYVIIPLRFSEIGEGVNPYKICSNAMKAFDEKSIKAVFKAEDAPEDYCKALNLNIMNASTFFKNKVKLELADCTNRIVWTGEGTGHSKDYPTGYYEAIVDAVKDMDGLPFVEHSSVKSYLGKQSKAPAVETSSVATAASSGKQAINLAVIYINNRYSVNVVDIDNEKKELRVVNDNEFKYQKDQVLALLAPTGIDNIYSVTWNKEDGSKQEGVANFSETELKISLKGPESEVISLQKYSQK